MYEQYYGFSEKPFDLAPDTGCFYRSEIHREALEALLLTLGSGDGFIKVTGEVGTGKTLICHKLLDSLEAEFDIQRTRHEVDRRALELVRQEMESAIELKVPLVVTIGSGRTWLEAH